MSVRRVAPAKTKMVPTEGILDIGSTTEINGKPCAVIEFDSHQSVVEFCVALRRTKAKQD